MKEKETGMPNPPGQGHRDENLNQNREQQRQQEQQVSSKHPSNKDQLDSRENLELNDFDEAGGHNRKATHEGDDAKTEHNDRRGMPPGPAS